METDSSKSEMHGMHVAHMKLFFSFKFKDVQYPCTLVEWFKAVGKDPDEDTSMWIIEPDLDANSSKVCNVIHIDSILHGAHLIPCFTNTKLESSFHFSSSLDTFSVFYVNKFADHHAHEVAF